MTEPVPDGSEAPRTKVPLRMSNAIWLPQEETAIRFSRSADAPLGILVSIDRVGEECQFIFNGNVVSTRPLRQIEDLNKDKEFVYEKPEVVRAKSGSVQTSWWSKQMERVIKTGMGST